MFPDLLEGLVPGLYLATLALLGLYGLHRLWMVRRFRWSAHRRHALARDEDLPVVTVQLPLYNERTVAARLVRAVGRLDYPADRLEVQVLDDSVDETRAIVDEAVGELRARGVDAHVVRREGRAGFKAGALAHGTERARGELLAVFDADFMPRPDFLRRMVPYFEDAGVGMVQARWEHENRDESALTRAQSTLLDGHFVVEHTVRHDEGLYFNFNGTAGVWRRAAIEDAGGWQHDTLTEDLDLSYRAQLAGWRFVYAPLESAPAEVPADLTAFRGQQHRWARGSVQVMRKLGGRIVRARVPLRVKLEAFAHLTGNAGYPLVVALAVLLPLVATDETRMSDWWHLAAFVVCTLSVVLFYDASQKALGRPLRARLFDVPAAMALGIGMSLSQTRAVLGGLLGGTGTFVRTPKRGTAPAGMRYRSARLGVPGLELVFACWFGWGLVLAGARGLWGALPFLALFFTGFAWVGVLSLRAWTRDRVRPARDDGRRVGQGLVAGEATPG